MKFDLLRRLYKSLFPGDEQKQRIRDAVQSSANVHALPGAVAADAADPDMDLVRDLLKNGIPVTELELVSDALIYLYFERQLIYRPDELAEAYGAIWGGSLSPRVLDEIEAIDPSSHRYIQEEMAAGTLDKCHIPPLLPFLEIQRQRSDMAPRAIQQARRWVDARRGAIHAKTSESPCYVSSAWLSGESEPTLPAHIVEWQFEDQERRRRANDPIYDGRPHDVLDELSHRADLARSFSYLCLEIALLLSPRRRHPDHKNDPSYVDVAAKIGERLAPLFPKAHDQAREANDFSAVTENSGIAKLVRALRDRGDLKQAAELCRLCIQYDIHDGTKRGFAGRLATIERELSEGQPKSPGAKRGRKPKLTDEQVQELVRRYLAGDRDQRKSLPDEYGITRSHMHYLISKNRPRPG